MLGLVKEAVDAIKDAYYSFHIIDFPHILDKSWETGVNETWINGLKNLSLFPGD